MITIYKIIAAAVIVTFISFSSLGLITRHNRELAVPSFAGMTINEAAAAAEKASLRIRITDSVYINNMERGTVYKQKPEAGKKVKKNRHIMLTINSISPRMVKMPSVTGYSLRQARAVLASQHLRIGKLTYVEDMATNNVLEQKYMGREISSGTPIESEAEIELVLGLNTTDTLTYIPDIKGMTLLPARDAVYENSLNIGRMHFDESVTDYSDSVSAYAYRTIPEACDTLPVKMGTFIDIYFTKDQTKLAEESKSRKEK